MGGFVGVVRKTGQAGGAGGGGTLNKHPKLKAAGVGCSFIILDEHGDPAEEAIMFTKVPGRQTVPCAEAWVLYLIILQWDGSCDVTNHCGRHLQYFGDGPR